MLKRCPQIWMAVLGKKQTIGPVFLAANFKPCYFQPLNFDAVLPCRSSVVDGTYRVGLLQYFPTPEHALFWHLGMDSNDRGPATLAQLSYYGAETTTRGCFRACSANSLLAHSSFVVRANAPAANAPHPNV